MLLTITTTHRPADELGFLLHKHPERVQRFEVSAGSAHVFYPESGPDRCTAALLLELDPIALARGSGGDGYTLGQYVNDRPYAASSLFSVALARVFGSAMKGQCAARPELAATALPLELRLPVVPSPGGLTVEQLFEPLGWSVRTEPIPLDPVAFPEWGDSQYVAVTLTASMRLADALTQLYVLLPVLDNAKHYWVSAEEIDKLVRAGGTWLAHHPEREAITRRYLVRKRRFTEEALERLAELEDSAETTEGTTEEGTAAEGEAAEQHDEAEQRDPSLAQQRRTAILAALRETGARTVADLGCGEGALLRELLGERALRSILGVDVAPRSLRTAARRLRLDELPQWQRDRIELRQGSVVYAEERLRDYDALVLSEVIEHLDPPRLPAFASAVFGVAHPRTVLVTTPNVEYNVRWDALPAGTKRHGDHRFEWTRAEFAAWAGQVCAEHGYTVRIRPIGPLDADLGAPTQLAIFERTEDRT
ncbi:3' terminal RNA ribose 2'-O-methyltransferase Hen1 [Sciscionella sediminilitoris]|uniref:3' terminal RNA ribose 2'-O-methyltransferase Hen1 n=1 Tax=Sciscionella sediminilitoris TaxID=1445613 RepID=UPI0004DF226F|nr:3' terminal RNA ribose 2'-O-methyltransferase Hen1 [Sciscionella sp. SE31]